jgi:hypothetical protein
MKEKSVLKVLESTLLLATSARLSLHAQAAQHIKESLAEPSPS